MLEQRADRLQIGIRQVLDLWRQALRKRCERFANFQDRDDIEQVIEDVFAAKLRDQLLAALHVRAVVLERLFHGGDEAVLEIGRELLGLLGVVFRDRHGYLFAAGPDVIGHQVAFEPGPDAAQRSARDAAPHLLRASFGDEKRNERLKQPPVETFDARRRRRSAPLLLTQFFEDEIETGKSFAAVRTALEFAQQHGAGSRRHLAQKLPQSLGC